MDDVSYRVLNDSNHTLEITCGIKTCTFRLNIKRAFTVLCKILEVYPRSLNIHNDLDATFNDPNRAYNDLKHQEGYQPYLIEGRDDRNSMTVALDVEMLCKYCTSQSDIEIYLGVEDQRKNLSNDDQQKIFDSCNGLCNITQIPVQERISMGIDTFCKSLKTVNYDHRRPLFKGGRNTTGNYQIISAFVNREKNKICKLCKDPKCEECALAYPESNNVIYPTRQNILELRRK